jgi:hypothetical protein
MITLHQPQQNSEYDANFSQMNHNLSLDTQYSPTKLKPDISPRWDESPKALQFLVRDEQQLSDGFGWTGFYGPI